jgi:hypothetical protein
VRSHKSREKKKCVENAIKLAPAKGFLKKETHFFGLHLARSIKAIYKENIPTTLVKDK